MQNQLRKERQSFSAALKGIYFFVITERHAWFHLIASMVAICAAWLLSLNYVEWILLLLCISMVWITEIFNTCLEKLCDLITTDHNPQIKVIKDMAAGAVLAAAVLSLIVGILIFLPKILTQI